MDYTRIYGELVQRGKTRCINVDDYYEKHHIVPKCLGGTDDSSNLVKLTPEEHYVAHQLLIKMHPNNPKLIYATTMLMYHNSDRRLCNKEYGWIKRLHSKNLSVFFREQWKNLTPEEYNVRVQNMSWSEERHKQHTEYMKNRYSDEVFYSRFVTTMSEVNGDIDKRQDASYKLKEKWKDPEYLEKMKNRPKRGSDGSKLKERWKDPAFKAMMLERRKNKKNETK